MWPELRLPTPPALPALPQSLPELREAVEKTAGECVVTLRGAVDEWGGAAAGVAARLKALDREEAVEAARGVARRAGAAAAARRDALVSLYRRWYL